MLFRKRHQRELQRKLAWEQTMHAIQDAILDAILDTEDTVELDLEWACGCSPDFPGLHYACERHRV